MLKVNLSSSKHCVSTNIFIYTDSLLSKCNNFIFRIVDSRVVKWLN